MKLSILPVSLFDPILGEEMTIGQWAKLAQESGADGYDVSTMFWKNHTATYIDAIRRDLDACGVGIRPNMACCYPDFTNPDRLERERQMEYLRRDIALASAFGFQYVRITAGMAHPGIEFDATCRRVAEQFAVAAEVAARFGIRLVFENHSKPGAWPLVDFSFDPDAFLTICRLMRSTGVGINFDTANAVACGRDPAAMLAEVMDQVQTVHLNDTASAEAFSPVLIGTGVVDFDGVFDVLNQNRFDGWVCIEECSNNGADGIREAIRFARKYIPA